MPCSSLRVGHSDAQARSRAGVCSVRLGVGHLPRRDLLQAVLQAYIFCRRPCGDGDPLRQDSRVPRRPAGPSSRAPAGADKAAARVASDQHEGRCRRMGCAVPVQTQQSGRKRRPRKVLKPPFFTSPLTKLSQRRWFTLAVESVRGAWQTHVVEPLLNIKAELFKTFRDRQSIVSIEVGNLCHDNRPCNCPHRLLDLDNLNSDASGLRGRPQVTQPHARGL